MGSHQEEFMSSSVFLAEQRLRGLPRGREHTVLADRVAVTFDGFSSAADAHRAAVSAFDALRTWLARQRRADPVRGGGRVLRAKRDGERWHLALNGVSIGGIIEPGDPRAEGIQGYGFELLLPPGLGPDAADRASRIIAEAIERHFKLEEIIAESVS
jgi:hypothetical protein